MALISSQGQFTNGAYHVLEQNDGFLASCHSTLLVTNFTFEVQMQMIKGGCGGIVFRDAPSGGHAYLFTVCTSGPRAGHYKLLYLSSLRVSHSPRCIPGCSIR